MKPCKKRALYFITIVFDIVHINKEYEEQKIMAKEMEGL
jgi:hypothetical protein